MTTVRQQHEASASRAGLAVFAALVAASAYGGAFGLIAGLLDLGAVVTARLPLHSPVLGGLALATLVALPFSLLARYAWRGDRRCDRAELVAGLLLVGWILIELAFIRQVTLFHPVYLVIGTALAWLGYQASGQYQPPNVPTK
ncbi:MAG: hypothetical protein ABI140_13405 [Jatrophihabitantaceae bacterium]